jgi:hypothetical protein
VLVVTCIFPAARRWLALLRAAPTEDRVGWLLASAVDRLPEDRAAWGQAMLAELDEIADPRERRRFCFGCVRAVAVMRVTATIRASRRSGWSLRATVLGAAVVALALAVYGLAHYPGLRTGGLPWLTAAFLTVVLLIYIANALALSQGSKRQAAIARRRGLLGGVIIGAAWLVVLDPIGPLKEWVAAPLAIALFVPAGLAAFTARSTNDARAATETAMWSGLIGGLLAFITWVTATYLRDGRPYDPQLLRDFHHSHSHDLTAYAVSDDLGAALTLLVLIPLIALALGSLSGRLTTSD